MRSSSPAWLSLLVGFTLPCGGCAETRSVALLSTAGVPVTATPSGDIPLEVVTRGTAVADPLPVRGTSIAYSDVEAALGLAVSTAGAYWAAAHRTSRADGFQLLVELTRAEAEQRGDRLVVSLDARATLRARGDRAFVAQTQAHCQQGGLVDAARGGAVVYACMTRLGRDLTGWLSAVQP